MQVTSLLSVGITLLEQGYEIGLDWLGQFVRAIIESVGIIGVGIICFTLILKAITLPFDVYQRVKMRKQTLIMRAMKDDLDKLQQQYANDKTMYNQKMMELYKKNGYSIFGACLPMIISLVVIIIAFQAFNAYSRYANLDFFVEMAGDYNAAILANGTEGTDMVLARGEDGVILVDGDSYTLVWTNEAGEEQKKPIKDGETFSLGGNGYTFTVKQGSGSEEKEYFLRAVPEDTKKYLFYEDSLGATKVQRNYYIDTQRLTTVLQETDKEMYDKIAAAKNDKEAENLCRDYVKGLGATAAKTWYDGHRANFLWVENVWYPDVSYNHPIPETYEKFKENFGNTNVVLEDGTNAQLQNIFDANDYEALTAKLSDEKAAPNGYFGLIILSIGLMVLSQFVMMRSQKESNQYQTVDGQGARTQKIMLIMMPIIYAIFAFMYSAAFTIYMLISSLFSLIVTLTSNLILGRIFKKKEEKQVIEVNTNKPKWLLEREAREKEQKKKDRKNKDR